MREIRRGSVDPQELIDYYGPDARVVAGWGEGMATELGQALAAEEMFCKATDENRLDPLKRARYLAGILARGGSLDPVHEYLLEEIE
jgi:hypothetical protein